MPESDSQIEYSGSAYLASKFFGLCSERGVNVGEAAGNELLQIFIMTRCQVRETFEHPRYAGCRQVLAEEMERIDIRTYAIIYQYAKNAAGKFLCGGGEFSNTEAQPLLSDGANLYKFLGVMKNDMAMDSEGSSAMRILFSKIIGILSGYSIKKNSSLLGNLRIICEEAWEDAMAEVEINNERRRFSRAAGSVVVGVNTGARPTDEDRAQWEGNVVPFPKRRGSGDGD